MIIDHRAILYSKEMSPLEFNFETLSAPSMYNWLNPYDIQSLYDIATSIKHAANIKLKKKTIDEIMTRRGCKKIGGGTNRVVYAPYESKVNCFKIALDVVGIHDNPSEYQNQFLIKPFVTKMFEHSPCGVISNVERVKAVQSKEEYLSIAPDIFNLLTNKILGKYVLEDIGTQYMFNYGVRLGFGAVLLDYPMVFELDGAKMYCNNINLDGSVCGGEIDYDDGFNHLYCTRCGKRYQARKLATNIQNKQVKIEKGDVDMNLVSRLTVNGKVVSESEGSTETIPQKEVLGVVRTRKVKMTPKEIKRMENERRRKEKLARQEEESQEPVAVLNNNTRETIGDVAGEQIKEITKEPEVREIALTPEELQELMASPKVEEEPDYSGYDLPGVEEVKDEVVEEEIDNTDPSLEEVENFEPIKTKLSKKFENL